MTRRPQKPAVAQRATSSPSSIRPPYCYLTLPNIHHHPPQKHFQSTYRPIYLTQIYAKPLYIPLNPSHTTQPSQWTKQRSSSRCRASSSRTAASSSPGAASVRLHSVPSCEAGGRNDSEGTFRPMGIVSRALETSRNESHMPVLLFHQYSRTH